MRNSNNKPTRRSARRSARSSSDRNVQGASSYSRSAQQGGRPDTRSFSRSNYGSGDTVRPVRTSSGKTASSYSRSASWRDESLEQNSNNPYSRHAGGGRGYVDAQHQRKKKSKRKRIALVAFALVAVLAFAGVGAAWAYLTQLDSAMHEGLNEDALNSLAVTDSPTDPFYMLLIGVDKSEAREAEGGWGNYRTDSIILARIDPQDKTVSMISIPRDTRVEIEGYGEQKINAAYAYGGPAMAIDTVSELAGVEINHYAEVDFEGFQHVVDALGGIEVNVPMEINDDLAGGYVPAGQQTLNGEQALILCRSRHAYDNYGNGDAMRAANQRMVLSAIMQKVMSSDVATMTNTVGTLSEYITTDFSVASIVGLAQSMVGIDVEKNVYTAGLPTTSVYENDLWWEVVDEDAWREMMERVDQGLSPTEESIIDEATGVTLSSSGDGGSSSGSSGGGESASLSGVKISVKNGAGISGVAADAASRLTPLGAIAETGNADDSNYQETLIIYDDASQEAQAQAIADALGCGKAQKNTGVYAYSGDFLVVVGADWS